MKSRLHTGRVTTIDINSKSKDVGYYIQEGNESYFVHLGDIQDNENLLYKLYDEGKLTRLKPGDKVQFNPFVKKHAINVKKVK